MLTKENSIVTLGKTGINISPVGLGTWAWGDTMVWAYGKEYTDEDIKNAFEISVNCGITFVDTAEVYGRGKSEELTGTLIKQTGADVIVATKFLPYPWRLSSRSLRKALRRSLGRLQRESVDLYQIHWPFPPVSMRNWMDAMADAVDDGLVKAVGISNCGTHKTLHAYDQLAKRNIPLASNQVEYSLLKRNIETSGLMDTCNELGITVIAYSPLAMGMLTGKYSVKNPPPGVRGRRFSKRKLMKIEMLNGLMRELGENHNGKSPAQVALNWTICKGTVPIPGAKNAQQAEQNSGALGWRLSEEEVSVLDRESGG